MLQGYMVAVKSLPLSCFVHKWGQPTVKAPQTRTVFSLPPQHREAPLHKSTCSESLEIEIQRSEKASFYLGLFFVHTCLCTKRHGSRKYENVERPQWLGFQGETGI